MECVGTLTPTAVGLDSEITQVIQTGFFRRCCYSLASQELYFGAGPHQHRFEHTFGIHMRIIVKGFFAANADLHSAGAATFLVEFETQGICRVLAWHFVFVDDHRDHFGVYVLNHHVTNYFWT